MLIPAFVNSINSNLTPTGHRYQEAFQHYMSVHTQIKQFSQYKQWYLNGKLQSINYFNNKDERIQSTTWHPNGKLQCIEYYKDGLMHGIRNYWVHILHLNPT